MQSAGMRKRSSRTSLRDFSHDWRGQPASAGVRLAHPVQHDRPEHWRGDQAQHHCDHTALPAIGLRRALFAIVAATWKSSRPAGGEPSPSNAVFIRRSDGEQVPIRPTISQDAAADERPAGGLTRATSETEDKTRQAEGRNPPGRTGPAPHRENVGGGPAISERSKDAKGPKSGRQPGAGVKDQGTLASPCCWMHALSSRIISPGTLVTRGDCCCSRRPNAKDPILRVEPP